MIEKEPFGIGVEKELNDRYSNLFEVRNNLHLLTTFKDNYDIPIHSWYKYTQAFSPHLVSYFIDYMNISDSSYVLDPFAGVGTTPLVCQQMGVPCVGFEISPLSAFIANAKLSTKYDLNEIQVRLKELGSIENSFAFLDTPTVLDGKIDLTKFLPEKSIKFILGLLDWLSNFEETNTKKFFLVALLGCFEDLSNIRKHGSHYRFMNIENEGVKHIYKNGLNSFDLSNINPTIIFHNKILSMINDLRYKKTHLSNFEDNEQNNHVINSSIFDLENREEQGFSHVITSPPYLNRNNYIAQQKIELLLFKMISSFKDYRKLTKRSMRSHVEAEKQHKYSYSNHWIDSILEDISHEQLSYPTIPEMIRGYFEDIYATLRMIQSRSENHCDY